MVVPHPLHTGIRPGNGVVIDLASPRLPNVGLRGPVGIVGFHISTLTG